MMASQRIVEMTDSAMKNSWGTANAGEVIALCAIALSIDRLAEAVIEIAVELRE